MQSKYSRLDRYIGKELGISRRKVKPLLARKRIFVDGKVADDVQQQIGPFTHVVFDEQILQAQQPLYIMLNKPRGVVSATKDLKHKTVIDLLPGIGPPSLHIAGRLDFNSTGLMLLTNDGRWSRHISSPDNQVTKQYQVTVKNPITDEMVRAFEAGIYFEYEAATTLPASLSRLSSRVAQVTLMEGRYHQIKRMFGRFQNPVLELQRQAVGGLTLCPGLAKGESKVLSPDEAMLVFNTEHNESNMARHNG